MSSSSSHPADALQPRRDARWFTPGRIAFILLSTALLFALGAWTYRAVEQSLREIRANTLAAELDAEVRGPSAW